MDREKMDRKVTVKIVFLGDGMVGKTTFCKRFLSNVFEKKYKQTIGADIYSKETDFSVRFAGGKEEKIRVHWVIWDLAGQHTFQGVRATYYTGSRGAFLLYDVTRMETLRNLPYWLGEFMKYVDKRIGRATPFVVVANKTDLINHSQNHPAVLSGKTWVEKLRSLGYNTTFITASAKTGENVDRAFEFLFSLMLRTFFRGKIGEVEKVRLVG